MIAVNNITVGFAGVDLFTSVSFMINKRDRIGLVGKNGAGKSTLLKVLCGRQQPISGHISMPADIVVGYLPQQMPLPDSCRTVVDEASQAFDEVHAVDQRIAEINDLLANPAQCSGNDYEHYLAELSHLNERRIYIGVPDVAAEVAKVLVGLGFLQTDLQRRVGEFSGGWRMRIELAKILLQHPDVILLDEPTNHLDIEAIQWLEDFLYAYPGAVLLVSHDRAFLDNVTNRTIEINMGHIYDYKVSYSHFKTLQQERLRQQLAAYENQQKFISDTEKFIERFRYQATKANQVQSRIKQLEKLQLLEVDTLDNAAINIKFPPAPRSGDIVLETNQLSKSYGDHEVLKNIDMVVERGEKVAFVGRNGEGKTTLVKIIMGQLDHSGDLKIGHNVKIGYFAQNQDELLDPNLTVFETLDRIAVGDIRTKLRDILGAFLFSGEDIDKKVKVLSGGEHSRLSLAKLLLEPYNLLLLDEPTNHLDIRSKDILKNALLHYDGTLIVVSHDRYFLDGLTDKIYEFKNKKIHLHLGGIYNFLQRKHIADIKEIEHKDINRTADVTHCVSDNKKQYLERKEVERRRRSIRNRIAKLEAEIEKLEAEIDVIKHVLASPDTVAADELQHASERFSALNADLETQMQLWEQANNEFEQVAEPTK